MKHCQRKTLLIFFWYCIGNKHTVHSNSSGVSSTRGILFVFKLTNKNYFRYINALHEINEIKTWEFRNMEKQKLEWKGKID